MTLEGEPDDRQLHFILRKIYDRGSWIKDEFEKLFRGRPGSQGALELCYREEKDRSNSVHHRVSLLTLGGECNSIPVYRTKRTYSANFGRNSRQGIVRSLTVLLPEISSEEAGVRELEKAAACIKQEYDLSYLPHVFVNSNPID